jgi:hypothetical protein
MAKCKSCDADITWCDTVNGKLMPLDSTPDPRGLFVMVKGRTWKATDEDRKLARPTYTSHFATCKQADDWRSKR